MCACVSGGRVCQSRSRPASRVCLHLQGMWDSKRTQTGRGRSWCGSRGKTPNVSVRRRRQAGRHSLLAKVGEVGPPRRPGLTWHTRGVTGVSRTDSGTLRGAEDVTSSVTASGKTMREQQAARWSDSPGESPAEAGRRTCSSHLKDVSIVIKTTPHIFSRFFN